MDFPVTMDVFAAYVVATTILLLIPGPTIMLVVSYALARGPKAAAATVAGVGLGDFTAMTLSFLGLGALLAASAEWFVVLKWVGAAYLVWLGIKMWRAPPVLEEVDAAATGKDGRRMMIHCWIVTALNPKGIVFFIAFVPQFMDPAGPVLAQFIVFGGTFLVLAVLNAWAYAWLAASARKRITRPSVLKVVNRVGGSLLISAGFLTAAARRIA